MKGFCFSGLRRSCLIDAGSMDYGAGCDQIPNPIEILANHDARGVPNVTLMIGGPPPEIAAFAAFFIDGASNARDGDCHPVLLCGVRAGRQRLTHVSHLFFLGLEFGGFPPSIRTESWAVSVSACVLWRFAVWLSTTIFLVGDISEVANGDPVAIRRGFGSFNVDLHIEPNAHRQPIFPVRQV